MDKKLLIGIAVGLVAGVVFAPQISKLPLVSRLPQF